MATIHVYGSFVGAEQDQLFSELEEKLKPHTVRVHSPEKQGVIVYVKDAKGPVDRAAVIRHLAYVFAQTFPSLDYEIAPAR